MITLRPLPVLLALLALSASALAAPLVVGHQGYLVDGSDAPITASVGMRFFLYDAATNGALLWTGDASGAPCSVAVKAGYYAVTLGGSGAEGCGPALPAITDDNPRYLEVEISGARLLPRRPVTGALRAALSGDTQALNGVAAAAIVDATTGKLLASALPAPTATTPGGVQASAAAPNQWIDAISTAGVPHLAQPSFSNLSGSVAATQLPALTGDVTTTAGTTGTTLAPGAATNAKLAAMPAHTHKGNNTNAAGAPLDLTSAQLTADLTTFTDTAAGTVPASGGGSANFLRSDGTWATPAGLGTDATKVLKTGDTMSGALRFSNTDFMRLPFGTTAQRPAVGSSLLGMVRANTDTGALEFFNGTTWATVSVASGFTATGGAISTIPGYQVHIFTTSGAFTAGAYAGNVEVLVVGGGGGGGWDVGPGGGGGGVVYQASYAVAANQTISVTVGGGGSGATAGTSYNAQSGSASSFGTITANGGGAAGGWSARACSTGGSGGGNASNLTASCAGTASQGNAGGVPGNNTTNVNDYSGASGGGGAGQAGGAGQGSGWSAGSTTIGYGGNGLPFTITGTTTYYGGGGGATTDSGALWGIGGLGGGGRGNSVSGTPNTGGGGGGGGLPNEGGNGGSGIVIVRYPK